MANLRSAYFLTSHPSSISTRTDSEVVSKSMVYIEPKSEIRGRCFKLVCVQSSTERLLLGKWRDSRPQLGGKFTQPRKSLLATIRRNVTRKSGFLSESLSPTPSPHSKSSERLILHSIGSRVSLRAPVSGVCPSVAEEDIPCG